MRIHLILFLEKLIKHFRGGTKVSKSCRSIWSPLSCLDVFLFYLQHLFIREGERKGPYDIRPPYTYDRANMHKMLCPHWKEENWWLIYNYQQDPASLLMNMEWAHNNEVMGFTSLMRFKKKRRIKYKREDIEWRQGGIVMNRITFQEVSKWAERVRYCQENGEREAHPKSWMRKMFLFHCDTQHRSAPFSNDPGVTFHIIWYRTKTWGFLSLPLVYRERLDYNRQGGVNIFVLQENEQRSYTDDGITPPSPSSSIPIEFPPSHAVNVTATETKIFWNVLHFLRFLVFKKKKKRFWFDDRAL